VRAPAQTASPTPALRPTTPSAASVAAEEIYRAHFARHRSGDPHALNALMVAIYPLIHRIVFRLGGPRSREGHEDLVQSALEQVCRSIDTFEGRSQLSTFVYGVCHRVVVRSHRYERVRRWFKRDAEEATLPQAQARPDEALERERALGDARSALARLDDEERAAFVLHDLEEQPLDAVAEALRCSTRTVKRRLRSARERLLHAQA
jgi:RNA polymerase sigma-70 factor (ECF subfamily)